MRFKIIKKGYSWVSEKYVDGEKVILLRNDAKPKELITLKKGKVKKVKIKEWQQQM